jgi:hypothetical protein
LKGKEVLLKIVTPINDAEGVDTKFIELISNATNQQNEVSEADRRSNHDIQLELQKRLYNDYGYLYQRKAGEFHDGIQNSFVDKELVIDRLKFIKAYWAFKGEPAAARRTSEKVVFKEDTFYRILHDVSGYHEMFFSYLIFSEMEHLEAGFKKILTGTVYFMGNGQLLHQLGFQSLPSSLRPQKCFSKQRILWPRG